jgi:iron complex transport system ATP-binding protein
MVESVQVRPHTALSLDNVTFGYRREPIVQQVSLRLAAGDMVGLLGPNGAGKSTLLKLATGILRPSQGSVTLQGQNIRRLSQVEIARRVAVVPQDFTVQFAYTVRQIVELGRMPHMGALGVTRATDRAAIDAALADTSTDQLADRVFNELSGGERQRVLVALALAQDAGIVLLDEPTAHLDIKHQIEVLELLRRLNSKRGLTVLAALHDLNLAARYFPRLVLFRRQIVADGPPAHVLNGTLLSEIYGTPVRVGILRGEEHLSVLPPAYAAAPAGAGRASAAAVHVLAGGGSGELLMRTLADADVTFSAGPLNIGDSDHALASRLAALTIAEPPYAPVSPQGLAAARECMAAVPTVVVCPMPLGRGNVGLLESALDARRAGTQVILLEPGIERAGDALLDREAARIDDDPFSTIRERDFSGRGLDLYRALAQSGAQWVGSPADALPLLQSEEIANPAT